MTGLVTKKYELLPRVTILCHSKEELGFYIYIYIYIIKKDFLKNSSSLFIYIYIIKKVYIYIYIIKKDFLKDSSSMQ